MSPEIQTILFDMGGTLRTSLESAEALKRENVRRIRELVHVDASRDELSELLGSRAAAYKQWAMETRLELDEFDLWSRWMLPECPPEDLARAAVQLNQLWREATATREMLPRAREVLVQLFRRGYRLGIVSNTSSSVEVPRILRELEISGLFETVVLSCLVGIRKPDPAILLEATRRMGVQADTCVYVGDRHDRDVLAAREAGFARAVLIRGVNAISHHEPDAPAPAADDYIDHLDQLLELFRPLARQPAAGPKYHASCSTMWARHNFPHLSDFMLAASRLGFSRIELNHQFNSSMLQGAGLSHDTVSSIHEPCPADVSTEELKRRDWLMSSTDEDCRRHGLDAIKRSIDLAADLGLSVIVVHPGMARTDYAPEPELKRLFQAGRQDSDEYRAVKAELVRIRSGLMPARLPLVKKSLLELLDYAGRFGIRLGLENRYHYYDIPGLEEMGELLDLADPARLGFVYDVGHAHNLDRLGFYPHEEWLRRYSSRIVEVHLHDIMGTTDHLAPGLGDVDFDTLAKYLPGDAIRTLELQPGNTPEQVKAGLNLLARQGCIQPIS